MKSMFKYVTFMLLAIACGACGDDEYLFIDGKKYRYWCDGSTLDIDFPKGTKTYHALAL